MGYNTKQVRSAILNKWDWKNPKNNIPILVWGPPGIGKTWLIMSIIAQRKIEELELSLKNDSFTSYYTKKEAIIMLERLKTYTNPDEVDDILNRHTLIMRLAERPIEQIEGVPAPNFELGYTKFLMPENLIYLKSSDWVVVFLDELDKASASKMAAVTHLIENLRVGDFSLPKDTFIIAAANRTQDSFLSKPVSPELCNRMAHVELDPDILSWVDWAEPHGVEKEIINFHKFNLMRNENYLVRYGYEDNEATSPRAFSSPRSWYNGSRLRNKVYKKYNCKYGENKDADQEALFELEQLVGEQSSIEFLTYLNIYSKVDIRKLLNGEQKIPTISDSETRDVRDNIMVEQYVYAFAIIEQLTEELLSPKHAMKNLVETITSMLPEIRTVFVQTIGSSNKKILKKIANHKDAEVLIDEIISYLSD